MIILEKAKEQGGRCELQVIEPIRKLVAAAGGNKEPVVETASESAQAFVNLEVKAPNREIASK